MPRSRSSSGGRGSGGMFGGSAPSRSSAPVASHPAPARRAPPPVAAPSAAPPATMAPSSGGGMLSGIGSTIVQGMAFGTGSAIAHRAVGAVAGSFGGSDEKEAAPAPAAAAPASYAAGRGIVDCTPFQRDFTKCLTDNRSDISSCQMYMDAFNQCTADAKLA